jgi:8-oxo-dGTP diphosphatase
MAPANEGVAGGLGSSPRSSDAVGGIQMTSAMASADDSLVELRCAVAIVRRDAVLLLKRCDRGDWVLPGGRPRPHESMGACVRREAREETGLDIQPVGCALVLEVNDPQTRQRLVELVFLAEEFDAAAMATGEPGRRPQWVRWEDLKDVALYPPIAGFLPDLARRGGKYARYLGNMWRPGPGI